jgi:hypothetical protein
MFNETLTIDIGGNKKNLKPFAALKFITGYVELSTVMEVTSQ